VPRSTAIRAAACTVLAAGLAAPLLRRRLRLKPPVVIAAAAATPFALAVLPRSRARDVGMCVLQMYAYVVTYQMPNDDPERLLARVRVEYPVKADRMIGRGTTPTLRLQRALSEPGRFRTWEKLLVWSHWVWFAFPHGTVAYVLVKLCRPALASVMRHRDALVAVTIRVREIDGAIRANSQRRIGFAFLASRNLSDFPGQAVVLRNYQGLLTAASFGRNVSSTVGRHFNVTMQAGVAIELSVNAYSWTKGQTAVERHGARGVYPEIL